jgi:hypothetical protein
MHQANAPQHALVWADAFILYKHVSEGMESGMMTTAKSDRLGVILLKVQNQLPLCSCLDKTASVLDGLK